MSIQGDNILRTDSYVFLSLFTLLEEGRCAGLHDEENGTLYKPFKLLRVHDFLLIWQFLFEFKLQIIKESNILSNAFVSHAISRIKSIACAKCTVSFLNQKKKERFVPVWHWVLNKVLNIWHTNVQQGANSKCKHHDENHRSHGRGHVLFLVQLMFTL